MVGRERELADIDEAIRAVRDGGRRVLALVGEAGIGKSALLAATAERAAAAGLQVLAGRAAEHEADVPFGLVVDLLDDRVADLHAPRLQSLGPAHLAALAAMLPAAVEYGEPGGVADRFRLHRAARAVLELVGGEAPTALLLDDLHWADGGSVELVLHLLLRPPRRPHLLVLALRPADAGARVLDAVRAAGGTVHRVDPLPSDAALALLAASGHRGDAGAAARIAGEAGGNPLYLLELARSGPGDGELPPSLVAAVQLEAARLPPASRTLLDGAAVAGDPFDLDVAAAAAGLDRADALRPLDRLVAAELVHPESGQRRFRFRHPVVRRAVYDAAPAGWRLAAHERAAAALTARGASAAARAVHVEQAAHPGDEDALDLLAAAAGEALATAPATAARWLDAALALLPADEDGLRRLMLLGPLALAHAATGRLDAAHAAVLAALGLPVATGELRLGLVVAASRLEQITGRYAEAEQRLTRELRALGEEQPPGRAELELQLATGALYPSDSEKVIAHAERAVAVPGAHPAVAVAAGALASLAHALRGEAAERAAGVDRALAAFRELDDEHLSARDDAGWLLAIALIWAGRYREADEVHRRALPRATAFGRMAMLGHRAAVGYCLGRIPFGLEAAEQAEEAARLMGIDDQLAQALWMKATLQHEHGDSSAAGRTLDDLAVVIARLEPGLIRSGAETVHVVMTHDGRPGLAAALTSRLGAELEGAERTWQQHWALWHLVTTALALGRPDEARRWADLADRRAGELQLPLTLALAGVIRATVRLAEGDAAGAAALARGAAARADAIEMALVAAEARLTAAAALVAAGDPAAAAAELRRVTGADTTGLVRLRARAAQELRRLGERTEPARTGAAAARDVEDVLTPRERDIARLVAEGRSNKEVAATVYLSEKTVEKHLSRVYEKLGVRGRAALAARFRDTP